MRSIETYQIIPLLMKDGVSELKIEARLLNIFHKELLKKAIRCDFSRTVFEIIAVEYPECIKVTSNEIIIYKNGTMIIEMRTSFNSLDRELNKQIIELWEKIAKEY